MMQIKGTHLQIPVRILHLFQGKFKQSTVIRLKFYSTLFFQNLLIPLARNSLDVSLLFA